MWIAHANLKLPLSPCPLFRRVLLVVRLSTTAGRFGLVVHPGRLQLQLMVVRQATQARNCGGGRYM